MSTTVHVKGISHETSEKEVKDFFSFCGKITNLSITPVSGDASAEKSATVTFEKETAAKTALLLDNTQLGKSSVQVSSAASIDQVAAQAGSGTTTAAAAADDHHHIPQEDKPRSRIIAEYLAHGYAISDNIIERAINVDKEKGFSNRFTSALASFDDKYKVTDKSKEVDNKYQVSNKAWNAWGGLNSYFEKALGTPTGQKIRAFYVEGEKQVTDVHNEARRLADIKKNQQEPHAVAGASGKTACSCGGEEGVCGCAPGKCTCASCAKSDNPNKTENPPQEVKGTDKTVCTCGGVDGVCGCAPGKCACASCSKSSSAAVTEVKEAAQASGQNLPKETFGTAPTSSTV